MKFSRMNYDKPRRCPNWAGAGWNNMLFHRRNRPWQEATCDGGFVDLSHWQDVDMTTRTFSYRFWKFLFHKCDKCGVITLPLITRNFDYYTYYLRIKYFDIHSYRYVRQFFLRVAPKVGWYSSYYFHTVEDEEK